MTSKANSRLFGALCVLTPLLAWTVPAHAEDASRLVQMAQATGDANLTPEELAKRKKAQQQGGAAPVNNGNKGAGNGIGNGNGNKGAGNGGAPNGNGKQKPNGLQPQIGNGQNQPLTKKTITINPTLPPNNPPVLKVVPPTGGNATTQTNGNGANPDLSQQKKHLPKQLTNGTQPGTDAMTPDNGTNGTGAAPADLLKKKHPPKPLTTTGTQPGSAPLTTPDNVTTPDLLQQKKNLQKGLVNVPGQPPAAGGGFNKPLTAAIGGAPLVLPKLGAPSGHLEDLTKGRQQHTEEGGQRTIIEEPGNRTIVQQGGKTFIHHDDSARFAVGASSVKSLHGGNGTNITIIVRPDGVKIFNVLGSDGRLMRRYRRDHDGHEVDLIDNRSFFRDAVIFGAGALVLAAALDLPPPHYDIPRDKYDVEYDRASDDDLIEALSAPPVERLERRYSLDEVLYSHELRERMRHIDLDTITFATGSWSVDPAEYPVLQRVADALKMVIGRHPGEVFLIEGHTDAVGSDIDNLSLSDRRAEEVARVLSEVFSVPPENLVTQGYGEQFLKIDTQAPERANRRVVIRRITPLMAGR